MRKLLLAVAVAALTSMPLAAPAYASGEGEVFGTLVGAGLGGLIGNQFGHGAGKTAFTVGGVVLGGIAGNSIGASMDAQDRAYAGGGAAYGGSSYYYQSPVYYPSSYVPNYVAPPDPPPSAVAYYNPAVDTYCREYTQQVRIGDQIQESYGTACLQPDGSWRVTPQ